MGTPICFPTIFVAYGSGIRSGNWRRCTRVNTPEYVINNYFYGIMFPSLSKFWSMVYALEKITWADIKYDADRVCSLLRIANFELNKLAEL